MQVLSAPLSVVCFWGSVNVILKKGAFEPRMGTNGHEWEERGMASIGTRIGDGLEYSACGGYHVVAGLVGVGYRDYIAGR